MQQGVQFQTKFDFVNTTAILLYQHQQLIGGFPLHLLIFFFCLTGTRVTALVESIFWLPDEILIILLWDLSPRASVPTQKDTGFILQKIQASVVESQKKKFCYPSLSFGKEETLIRILSAWDRSQDFSDFLLRTHNEAQS